MAILKKGKMMDDGKASLILALIALAIAIVSVILKFIRC